MWTTTELLADVRRRAGLADSGGRLSAADLLAFGDHINASQLQPMLRSLRESFLHFDEVQSIVSGQAEYSIPRRALGSGVASVFYVDANGDSFQLTEVTEDAVERYSRHSGDDYVFALTASSVRIAPVPQAARGSIRIRYATRIGRLVEASDAAQVSSVGASSFDVGGVGAFGSAGTVSIDIVKQHPPFRHLALAEDATWDGSSTFTMTVPDALEAGDWVTLTEQCVVIPLPDVLHPALSSGMVFQALRALGHHQEASVYKQEMQEEILTAREALEPRGTVARTIVSPRRRFRGWR